jgi:cell division protein ZapA
VSTPESGKSEPVSIRVLDREYTVGVTEAERASLTSAARMLDARMRELRGSNKMVAPDRLAVLTALNLAHELQQRDAVSASAQRRRPVQAHRCGAMPGSTACSRRTREGLNPARPADRWRLPATTLAPILVASSAVSDGVRNIRLVP